MLMAMVACRLNSSMERLQKLGKPGGPLARRIGVASIVGECYWAKGQDEVVLTMVTLARGGVRTRRGL